MTLAYIINGLLFVMPCIVLLLLIFKDQLKAPTLLRIFTGSTLFVIFSLWGTYIYFLFKTPLQHLLLSVLSMFSGVLIFSGACRYNFWQSLFIIAVIRSCSEIIRFFSYESYFLLRGELPEEPTLEVAFITTLLTILTFPAVRLFFRDLMRPALDYTVSLSAWKWVWLIPLSNSAVYTVAVAPEYSFRSTLTENESFLIPLLWALLTFSTHAVLLKMMIDVSKNAVLQENLHLSEVRIAAQQKQMELLQSHILKTAQFRHDMRHHLLALEGFLNTQDMEGLQAYIRQSAALFPVESPKVFCGSAAVNSLLCYYMEQAEKDQTNVSAKVSLQETLPIPDAELCMIIGNLLENAVEACRRMKSRERFLDMKLLQTCSSILTIQVCNSYEGEIRQMKDGSFLSSKREDQKGIGLSSVLSIAEKYNGITRIEHQDQIFKISVIISQNP